MDDFFSSLIKATRTYVGNDPLLPWLRGINKIKEVLPPEIVNRKLPRFIEKCTQTFCNDKRYTNDLRYLKLWIQLLEFVPNRGEVLSFMEQNKIGTKHALYYQAYALHYEKLKKFPQAEAMYKLGIQRLAAPAESLHQSYDSFLQRMASRKRRKLKSLEASTAASSENMNFKCNEKNHFESHLEGCIEEIENGKGGYSKGQSQSNGNPSLNCQDENAEKSCAPWYLTHETLDQPESSSECTCNILGCSNPWSPESLTDRSTIIYTAMPTDGETCDKDVIKNGNLLNKGINSMPGENGFKIGDGYLIKEKTSIEGVKNLGRLGKGVDPTISLASKFCSEDTISIGKSIASAVLSGNEEVENACHHGLVDPTINTKEVIEEINHMFCEPLHADHLMKKPASQKNDIFQILPNEDLEDQDSKQQSLTFNISNENNASVPAAKGFQGFVDENLFCNSSKEVLEKSHSSGYFPPVKDLQILADESFNGQQKNISKDEDLLSDICTTEGKEWNEKNNSLGGMENHGLLDQGTVAILSSEFCSEDTIIIRKFVDSAIVGGTEEVEYACHHGLVEPTINTKEAMADINDMFGKPLHFDNLKRSRPPRTETNKQPVESFQIFADEDLGGGDSKQQCIPSNVFEEHGSAVPFVKDFHIFADENIITKSSKEVPQKSCSSGALAPVQGLQIFADASCKESQQKISIQCNISKEDRSPSVKVEADQGEWAREDREWKKKCSSEGIKVQQLGEGGYPTASLPSKFCNEDTIIIRKFVDSAIVGGTEEVEYACHHGLVEPTINTKEAIADINDMFGKPLHFDNLKRSQPPRIETNKQSVESFQIFADGDLGGGGSKQQCVPSNVFEEHNSAVPFVKDFHIFADENIITKSSKEVPQNSCSSGALAPAQGLQIFADASCKESQQKTSIQCNISKEDCSPSVNVEADQDEWARGDREWKKKCSSEGIKIQQLGEGAYPTASLPSKFCNEDSIIIRKFVGSAIVGNPEEVEDASHHGLVEPTINTKEAIADINDMFGKPLHFDKLKSRSQPLRTENINQSVESFQILVDEELEEQCFKKQIHLSAALEECGSSVPFVKDINIFVDEDLLSKSSKKSCSTGELAPIQSLQALADKKVTRNQQKGNTQCNTSKDKGLSPVPAYVFGDVWPIEDRKQNKRSSLEVLKGHGQLGESSSSRLSSPSKFFSEDTTIIHKFVDSTIVSDTELGDPLHHGLVEPTVNTKEAMADINDMFSKPLHIDKLNTKSTV